MGTHAPPPTTHHTSAPTQRRRPVAVCAEPARYPHFVSLQEHAAELEFAPLLPGLDAAVAGLRCLSPCCCDARHRAVYASLRAYAVRVRRWRLMTSSPSAVSIGISKVGPNFEQRVTKSIDAALAAVTALWKAMHASSLVAKKPIRVLAPAGGGPPQHVDDLVNALAPDVLSLVLERVIREKLGAGEPVGNICRLRRTCAAFAVHPLFYPFVPRLILYAPNPLTGAYRAFPHRPRSGDTPAAVCARRELALDLRVSLPGDPASEPLLATNNGPLCAGVDLNLSLQMARPDGSVQDATERFVQKRELARRTGDRFCLQGPSVQARARFRFGLLSSTIDSELRQRTELAAVTAHCSAPRAPLAITHTPRSTKVVTATWAVRRQRGECGVSIVGAKRVCKRVRGATLPLTTTTFRFVVTPTPESAGPMPFLRWESESFVSVAA